MAGRGRPWHIVAREHEEHDHLVEDVVEQDDSLLARYLEGELPTAGELERAMHDGVDRAVVFPVLLGSAVGPVAVDRLAEFICHVVVEVPCDADGPPGWWPATSPRSRS